MLAGRSGRVWITTQNPALKIGGGMKFQRIANLLARLHLGMLAIIVVATLAMLGHTESEIRPSKDLEASLRFQISELESDEPGLAITEAEENYQECLDQIAIDGENSSLVPDNCTLAKIQVDRVRASFEPTSSETLLLEEKELQLAMVQSEVESQRLAQIYLGLGGLASALAALSIWAAFRLAFLGHVDRYGVQRQ